MGLRLTTLRSTVSLTEPSRCRIGEFLVLILRVKFNTGKGVRKHGRVGVSSILPFVQSIMKVFPLVCKDQELLVLISWPVPVSQLLR